jgi:hypothetical protein
MALVSKIVLLAFDGPLTVSTFNTIGDTLRGMYLEQGLSGEASVSLVDDGKLVTVTVEYEGSTL